MAAFSKFAEGQKDLAAARVAWAALSSDAKLDLCPDEHEAIIAAVRRIAPDVAGWLTIPMPEFPVDCFIARMAPCNQGDANLQGGAAGGDSGCFWHCMCLVDRHLGEPGVVAALTSADGDMLVEQALQNGLTMHEDQRSIVPTPLHRSKQQDS